MSTEMVIATVESGIATLTMNRPEKRNALSAALVTAMLEAFEQVRFDPSVRVVVLTGAGKAFSAGADLAALEALQTATPLENLADSQHLARLFSTIHTFPKPVIAQINGHAIAGGCGLAAVCDISIASDRAKLGFTEVRIGFVPAIVMVYVLRKLGETATRTLFLRGHLITAKEAAEVGLISECVEDGGLAERVHTLAREMADYTSPSAIGLTKQMLAAVPGMGLEEALSYATQMNALARGTADCKAGIAAFLRKEKPPWNPAEKKSSAST